MPRRARLPQPLQPKSRHRLAGRRPRQVAEVGCQQFLVARPSQPPPSRLRLAGRPPGKELVRAGTHPARRRILPASLYGYFGVLTAHPGPTGILTSRQAEPPARLIVSVCASCLNGATQKALDDALSWQPTAKRISGIGSS